VISAFVVFASGNSLQMVRSQVLPEQAGKICEKYRSKVSDITILGENKNEY